MADLIQIPLLNPLRPVLQTDRVAADSGTVKYYSYNPQFNTMKFDDGAYLTSLRDYEDKNGYLQPFQQSDTIRLQFFGTDTTTSNYTLQLLDSQGRLISKTLTITQETGTYNGYKLYTCPIYLYDVTEGVYFVRLRYNHGSTTYSYVLFEPINVKQVHNNTIRLDYYNSYNDADVVYPSSSWVFQLRVNGCLTDMTTESKYNVYEDQPMNLTMVAGIPFRVYEVTFGRGMGIPDWLIDKIERVTLCDTLKIDGKLYTRAESSKLEAKKSAGNPLSTATIKLRESSNLYSKPYAMQHKLIALLPGTEYFYVSSITIQGVSQTVNTYFNGNRNFIDYLNARLCPFDGYFAENKDGYLIFVNESATAFSGSWTLSNYLPYGLRFEIIGAGDVEFEMTGNNLQTYRVVYGDGTSDSSGTFTGVGSPVNIAHTYTGVTTKYMYVFFTNIVDIYDIATNAELRAIGGNLGTQAESVNFGAAGIGIRCISNNIFSKCSDDTVTSIIFDYQSFNASELEQVIRYLYDSLDALDASCIVQFSVQTFAETTSKTDGMAELRGAIVNKITSLDIA